MPVPCKGESGESLDWVLPPERMVASKARKRQPPKGTKRARYAICFLNPLLASAERAIASAM
jgi:hypothetical protein